MGAADFNVIESSIVSTISGTLTSAEGYQTVLSATMSQVTASNYWLIWGSLTPVQSSINPNGNGGNNAYYDQNSLNSTFAGVMIPEIPVNTTTLSLIQAISIDTEGNIGQFTLNYTTGGSPTYNTTGTLTPLVPVTYSYGFTKRQDTFSGNLTVSASVSQNTTNALSAMANISASLVAAINGMPTTLYNLEAPFQTNVTSIAAVTAQVNNALTVLTNEVNTIQTAINNGPVGHGRLINVQYFTSSGTYTPTSGTTSVIVEVQGGGGGGAGAPATAANQGSAGTGGGGGGYAKKRTYSVASTSVTVGAGGAGGAGGGNGAAGGTSSFGSIVSANGGAGGTSGVSPANSDLVVGGSSGGTTSGGDINIPGGYSDSVFVAINFLEFPLSSGGKSVLGTGGQGTYGGNGSGGIGYGGGGGGATSSQLAGALSGGGGASGIVIVSEYS